MNINEPVDVISSFEALHCESSCNLDELHGFATVELLRKKIRSRETIKGVHVLKFPLFEEIHFDSFQKPWFSFTGQTDESW